MDFETYVREDAERWFRLKARFDALTLVLQSIIGGQSLGEREVIRRQLRQAVRIFQTDPPHQQAMAEVISEILGWDPMTDSTASSDETH